MNPQQKSGLHPINTRLMRLELLMRAHEVARRIDERVRRVLDRAEPPQARPDSRTEPADAAPSA
jgi:hypothetical protein